jgi:leucyl aminopeptidase
MPTTTLGTTVPRAASVIDVPVAAGQLDRLGVDDRRFAEHQGFEAKVGQVLALPGGDGAPARVLVGLGEPAALDVDVLRRAAAAYARAASRHLVAACTLLEAAGQVDRADALEAVVEGIRLASYRYTTYKEAPEVRLRRVTVVGRGPGLKAALARADATCDAVALARDLVNEPGGSLTPVAFARRAEEVGRAAGLEVAVWDAERIAAERLGGLVAVSRGSEQPPRYVRLRYRPSGTPSGVVTLVGKGITFDSGGLSIKTGQGMMSMKVDMAGAAAVLATMSALGAVGATVEVRAELPLTDNMTGGDAQRPGDVFRARNGKTVEVLNTDAEGRLVLADALSLAAEEDTDAIIDIATLTGACSVALGSEYAGVMGTDDATVARLERASGRTGEPVWRLPLPDRYRTQLDSPVADLKNIGGGPYGGALLAGLFLREFTGGRPWAHVDLGLSALAEADDGVVVRGATGIGVRLLLDALRHWDLDGHAA